jgi:7-cyano-7-deazaguanine reductase
MNPFEFEALGKKVEVPSRKLEVFPKPVGVEKVVLDCDEVTSLCPVTGQPDWETVMIEFVPNEYCIESKSLKLYLWSYREEGMFCEALAGQIAQDVYDACKPHWCTVTVSQKSRGGIKITAIATVGEKK